MDLRALGRVEPDGAHLVTPLLLYVAASARSAMAERGPDPEAFLPWLFRRQEETAGRKQTAAETVEAVRALNRALGGEEV